MNNSDVIEDVFTRNTQRTSDTKRSPNTGQI